MRTEFPTFRGRVRLRRARTVLGVVVVIAGGVLAACDATDGLVEAPPAVEQPGEQPTDPEAASELAATVNGQLIPLSAFQQQAFAAMSYFVDQGLDPNTAEGQEQLRALRRQVLDDLINQVLIEQFATAQQVVVTDEDVAAGLQEDVNELGGEAEFTAYLEQAQTTLEAVTEMKRQSLVGSRVMDLIVGDIPSTGVHVHARHILCEDLATCQTARDRIISGEDFAVVAKEVSADVTTAERGGDLDWIPRGMLPSPVLEDAIFSLAPGSISPVVESEFGFHVIEAVEVDDTRPLSEEQQFALREKRFLDWIGEQRRGADVVVHLQDYSAEDTGE